MKRHLFQRLSAADRKKVFGRLFAYPTRITCSINSLHAPPSSPSNTASTLGLESSKSPNGHRFLQSPPPTLHAPTALAQWCTGWVEWRTLGPFMATGQDSSVTKANFETAKARGKRAPPCHHIAQNKAPRQTAFGDDARSVLSSPQHLALRPRHDEISSHLRVHHRSFEADSTACPCNRRTWARNFNTRVASTGSQEPSGCSVVASASTKCCKPSVS